MKRACAALLALLSARAAQATTYSIAQGPNGPGITTELSYSMGTHDNKVLKVAGEVRAEGTISGRLTIAIDSLVSGNNERDCHMREALGLDYAKSKYPGEHVCQNDALPAGAIAFPEISLALTGGAAPDVQALAPGKETPLEVQGDWTIHGVTRPARLHLTISPDASAPGAVRVRGMSLVKLSDFGVQVKSAKVLFATISVGEVATVHFDLKLIPTH